jgi:hypothetical protein
MAAVDDREPPPTGLPRDGRPARKPKLQRCRDCREYEVYGPAICSYCLSERLEWVRAAREKEGHPPGTE